MPNNSRNDRAVTFSQEAAQRAASTPRPFDWHSAYTTYTRSNGTTGFIPATSDRAEMTEGEQEASDESYALPSTEDVELRVAADLVFQDDVPTPPADPMEPHESDTHAIRYFRDQIRRTPENHTDLASLHQVVANLTREARSAWVNHGGRRSEPVPPAPRPRRTREGGAAPGRFSAQLSGSMRINGHRDPENNQTFFGNIPDTATMTTVASHFGMRVNYPSIEKHPLIVGTNLAGVEIELENITRDTPNFRYWTAKGDGSLRNNGMEFVCSHPWGGVDLYNAAVEIDGFLFNDGNAPDTSWRCSTHVHIDVRDMTAAQVKKMILAYVFYERVLFRCSGWQRYKNNFCVALGFAQGQLEDLGNWWAESDSRFFHNLSQRWDKYTAINFLPIGNFGSIEFRISEAKWHKGQLIRLTNRFLSLKEVAMANSDLSDEDFVNLLMQSEPSDIIKKGIPKGMGNMQEDLEFGFKLAHDILSLARLRRRSRRLFAPNFEDGSRIITVPRREIFMNGWNHCVSHLRDRYPNLEFFDIETVRSQDGETYQFTFNWLAELYDMMRRHRLTFEIEWFLPTQNRSQLTRLWNNFLNERVPTQVQPEPNEESQDFFEGDDEDDEEPDVEW